MIHTLLPSQYLGSIQNAQLELNFLRFRLAHYDLSPAARFVLRLKIEEQLSWIDYCTSACEMLRIIDFSRYHIGLKSRFGL